MRLVLNNFYNLGFIKLFLILFPLIITPILISKLGLPEYGHYAFYMGLFSYAVVFISYGFEETGALGVSRCVNDGDFFGSRHLAFSIYTAKSFLLVIVSAVLLLLYFALDLSPEVLCFLILGVSEVFNPIFYLHGCQKLFYVSAATLVSKVSFLIFVLFFVDEYSSPASVVFANGFIALIVNFFVSSFYVFGRFDFSIKSSISAAPGLLRQSASLGMSNFIPTIKDKGSVVILGMYGDMNIVAIFDLMMKYLGVAFMPVTVLNSSYFPKMSINYSWRDFRNILFVSMFYSVLCLCGTALAIPYLVDMYYPAYSTYTTQLSFLVLAVVFYSLSVLIAKNYLIVKSYLNDVLYSTLAATMFYCLLAYLLILYNSVTVSSLVILTVATFFVEMVLRIILISVRERKLLG